MSPAPLLLTDPIPAVLPILPDHWPCLTGLIEPSPQECPPFSYHLARTITPITIATIEYSTLELITNLTHQAKI
jgi:hypothetical protein